MFAKLVTLAVATTLIGTPIASATAGEQPAWNMKAPSKLNVASNINTTGGGKRLETSGMAFSPRGDLFVVAEDGTLLKFSAQDLAAQRSQPAVQVKPDKVPLLLPPHTVDFEAISIFSGQIYLADEETSSIYAYNLNDYTSTGRIVIPGGVINSERHAGASRGLEGLKRSAPAHRCGVRYRRLRDRLLLRCQGRDTTRETRLWHQLCDAK